MTKKFEVSIIVPVFNEEQRIKPFLKDMKAIIKPDWEIIFVNDGSNDNSLNVIKKSGIKNIRIISYKTNRGKGHAVKKGVEAAKGNYIIFIDADGSIHPKQIMNMLPYLKKYEIVVGTRASKESQVKQSLLRKLTGIAFNMYVNFLYKINIKDNLCGFKGFRGSIAKGLFHNLISERWIFDVELFYKIRNHNIDFYELPIRWNHKKNSKISFIDPFIMVFELIYLRVRLASQNEKIH